jgi:hypothetical protein
MHELLLLVFDKECDNFPARTISSGLIDKSHVD